ncbi:hypothetical protein [Sphingomonas sp. 3-13AW]|uniref:hypothetical protein n=1 Tax=Sphingomonas sp. 3-13AW TaxID=3050450 RepID=UPI003BB6873D
MSMRQNFVRKSAVVGAAVERAAVLEEGASPVSDLVFSASSVPVTRRFRSYDEVVALLRQAIADAEAGQYVPYAGIGSRETPGVSAKYPGRVCGSMRVIAQRLHASGLTLRSGGAEGADEAFEAGSSPERSEVFIIRRGIRGSRSPLYPRPENAHITAEAEKLASLLHPKWAACGDYARQMHTRNMHQVLGVRLDSPSRFIIAWTKDGADTGGTGQAIRCGWHKGVPVVNLKILEHRQAVCDVFGFRMEWFGDDAPVPLARLLARG